MKRMTYTEELKEYADGFMDAAEQYKKERQIYAKALNGLTGLIYRADLHDDKASFENKLIKLLATPYASEAKPLIEQLNLSRANYKGWNIVCEAYKAQISSIQSVIKYNLTGETAQAVSENANLKYDHEKEIQQYL